VCITVRMTEFMLVSSDETRDSSTVSGKETRFMSAVADGLNRNIFVPLEEYVCCYTRDYSENLTGNNTADGHCDVP